MARILLTGGSGFIAAHVLDTLLERGHSVVTTVRSEEKARRIREAHPGVPKEKLDFVIVPDISKPDAINGTMGILHAIKKSAPTVKRVVITSSFAAIIDTTKPPTHVYSENDWNQMTEADAATSPFLGYRASKKFAEKAAWDFMEKEKPNFTLATCNPPLVIGPVVHYLSSLDAINTSNERIRDFITGAAKQSCPPTASPLWVDVRDIAVAHALAAEKPEAANQRFFIVAGKFCNKDMVEVISDEFPELRDKLPQGEALKPGEEVAAFGFDNRKSKEVLGLSYRPFRESIVDTVKSLEPLLSQVGTTSPM
ncbi:conserved hypothetical protein [Uncinocarpus reesii 1704]|uniref:NAD-dependent epimerase/dehydratase domain-containing protein n=1 Tax=Uncinocarpus reesii (strain UAMH 1704) TaxID=336963 RepID=C4JWE9_UNCRE|nr:uncharacterized protein UREG_06891 [Uncinocarpus reesii 1704]EEP82026.1 conserved hypothetical protein [Uncinocarpus reesii 1704]